MKIKYFKSATDFRRWLEKNHATTQELWVGYYKKASGKPTITWPESVDKALCFGWIDGIRKSVDDWRYMIRFTPRRRGSIWSAVNIKRARELREKRLMELPGIAAFNARKEISRAFIPTNKGALSSTRLTKEGLRKTRRHGISFMLSHHLIEKQLAGG
jgi:uncharacterized protein YdeI (YjbR/CyaY-like superfamily)